jgi:amidase
VNRILRVIRVGWSLLVGVALDLARVQARRLRRLDFASFEEALADIPPERHRQVGSLLADASIAQVQEALRRGELTSVELTLHFLARIRQHDPSLHSVIELNPEALSEARAADAHRGSGAVGPLQGIPLTIKDNIATVGPMHTTAGSMALADHVAARDAAVVTALRSAGAIILGKANLSELAGAVARTPGVSAVGGQTRNPYGDRFTPGGSSSGSAVSVATYLCMASVGTETSGSLLAPAAFNGVVGMKPSAGLVSGDGIVPLVRSQDSAGPVARCVADAATLLSAIATGGLDVELSAATLQGVAVGVLRDDILSQKSPFEDTSDNASVLSRILDGLRGAGASTRDVTLATDGPDDTDESALVKVVLGGLTHDTMGYLAAAGAAATNIAELHAFDLRHPRARMPKGQFFVSLAYFSDIDRASYETAALDVRRHASRVLEATFDQAGVEVLLSISNLHSATYAAAGYPAINVPVGLRANGMPVGATLIGRAGGDARLLGSAYAFEQATLLRVEPPATGLP